MSEVDHPGIPGARNEWYPGQGQARRAALTIAVQLGPGYRIAHDPRPARGLPHYHIVNPRGERISGHFFYGRRPPRRVLRGRPWREAELEAQPSVAEAMASPYRQGLTPAEALQRLRRAASTLRAARRELQRAEVSRRDAEAAVQAASRAAMVAGTYPYDDDVIQAGRRLQAARRLQAEAAARLREAGASYNLALDTYRALRPARRRT
jgi:hypothetical protein